MMKDQYMNTFNLQGGAAVDAYEKMIEQYDEFFEEQQQVVKKKMEVLLQGQTLWEVLQKAVETIENKQKIEYLHKIGQLPQQDFDEFQTYEKDAFFFFDSVIHT